MKDKQNQRFTTVDFLTLVVSFVAIGAITGPILKSSFGSSHDAQIQMETDKVARGLLRGQLPLTQENQVADSRAPASVVSGLSSHLADAKDPWGSKYHYKVAKNESGQPAYLVVWSTGPDKVSDSETVEVKSDGVGGMPRVVFGNDDVGSVVPVR